MTARCPITFTSNCRRTSVGGTASTGPLTTIPALFTIALSCVGNELASALMCSALVTSSSTGLIRRGFRRGDCLAILLRSDACDDV